MDIPVWIISLLISFSGLLLTGVAILATKLSTAKKEARETGEIVNELKNLREDVQNGNAVFITHSAYCKTQAEKLTIVEQSTKSAHKRIDDHKEKLSIHDQEIQDLKERVKK